MGDNTQPSPPRPDDGDGDNTQPPPPRPDDGDGPQTPADIGYFAVEIYQGMSAEDKLDDLWSQCEVNRTVSDQNWSLDNLFRQNMGTSFESGNDELP